MFWACKITVFLLKMSCALNATMDTEKEKELTEWKMCQLFKLQAELASFGGKTLPVWEKNLTPNQVDEKIDDANAPITGRYADMWYEARTGCLNIIQKTELDTRDYSNWLLDKRLNLRRELEEYGMKTLPELAAALGNNKEFLSKIDNQWCDTWKQALSLVTPQDNK